MLFILPRIDGNLMFWAIFFLAIFPHNNKELKYGKFYSSETAWI